jgi:hypothetical protein
MSKLAHEVPLDSEPTNSESSGASPEYFYPADTTPSVNIEHIDNEATAEIIAIQKEIADTLQSKEAVNIPPEHTVLSPSNIGATNDPTILDRFPTLAKWARRFIFVAGITAAGAPLANAAEKNYFNDEQRQEQVIKDPHGKVVGVARTHGKDSPIVTGVIEGDVNITNGNVSITPHKEKPFPQTQVHQKKEVRTNTGGTISGDVSVITHEDGSPAIIGGSVGGKITINGKEIPQSAHIKLPPGGKVHIETHTPNSPVIVDPR